MPRMEGTPIMGEATRAAAKTPLREGGHAGVPTPTKENAGAGLRRDAGAFLAVGAVAAPGDHGAIGLKRDGLIPGRGDGPHGV